MQPPLDRSLELRRWLMQRLLGAVQTPLGKAALSANLRAASPLLAQAAGEALVSAPRRALALTAHPDDLEFFAGGTLRRLALAGSFIEAWVLSDGEKHGSYPQTGKVRRAEQERAGRRLGYARIRFFGLPDFALPEDPRLETLVDEAWGRVKPDVLLAFDPQELIARMANRDHKALGRAVMDVARRRYGQGTQVYFYGTRQANVLVDIEPVLEDKLKAVECHDSQLVYLTREQYRAGFRLMAEAFAAGSAARFAEGLYRLF